MIASTFAGIGDLFDAAAMYEGDHPPGPPRPPPGEGGQPLTAGHKRMIVLMGLP